MKQAPCSDIKSQRLVLVLTGLSTKEAKTMRRLMTIVLGLMATTSLRRCHGSPSTHSFISGRKAAFLYTSSATRFEMTGCFHPRRMRSLSATYADYVTANTFDRAVMNKFEDLFFNKFDIPSRETRLRDAVARSECQTSLRARLC